MQQSKLKRNGKQEGEGEDRFEEQRLNKHKQIYKNEAYA